MEAPRARSAWPLVWLPDPYARAGHSLQSGLPNGCLVSLAGEGLLITARLHVVDLFNPQREPASRTSCNERCRAVAAANEVR